MRARHRDPREVVLHPLVGSMVSLPVILLPVPFLFSPSLSLSRTCSFPPSAAVSVIFHLVFVVLSSYALQVSNSPPLDFSVGPLRTMKFMVGGRGVGTVWVLGDSGNDLWDRFALDTMEVGASVRCGLEMVMGMPRMGLFCVLRCWSCLWCFPNSNNVVVCLFVVVSVGQTVFLVVAVVAVAMPSVVGLVKWGICSYRWSVLLRGCDAECHLQWQCDAVKVLTFSTMKGPLLVGVAPYAQFELVLLWAARMWALHPFTISGSFECIVSAARPVWSSAFTQSGSGCSYAVMVPF